MKLSFILALLAVPVGASAFLGPTTTASTVGKASSTSIQIASGLNPPDESPNMFQAMGDIWNREVTSAFESSDDDVVIEPDFTLPWLFIVSGAFIYFQNLGELKFLLHKNTKVSFSPIANQREVQMVDEAKSRSLIWVIEHRRREATSIIFRDESRVKVQSFLNLGKFSFFIIPNLQTLLVTMPVRSSQRVIPVFGPVCFPFCMSGLVRFWQTVLCDCALSSPKIV